MLMAMMTLVGTLSGAAVLEQQESEDPIEIVQEDPTTRRIGRRILTGAVSCVAGMGCCTGSWTCVGCGSVGLVSLFYGIQVSLEVGLGLGGAFLGLAGLGCMLGLASLAVYIPTAFILDMVGLWDWRTATEVFGFFVELSLSALSLL